jgi:hypothetical protein
MAMRRLVPEAHRGAVGIDVVQRPDVSWRERAQHQSLGLDLVMIVHLLSIASRTIVLSPSVVLSDRSMAGSRCNRLQLAVIVRHDA